MSSKKFPINPARPDRICWGCDLYCPVENMACGNGADRTQHPSELFGPDWMEFGLNAGKGMAQAGEAQAGDTPAPAGAKPGSGH